jgi:hypothetical protein
MEVRNIDVQQLSEALRGSVDYVARLQQFHLSTRPMFFRRDSWNQTNDMLLAIKQQNIDNLNLLNMMVKGNSYGAPQYRRPALVRQIQGRDI